MKRYLVFAGSNYYPSGGWEDFKRSWDELDMAKAFVDGLVNSSFDWAHIVDSNTQQVIYSKFT